MRLSTVILIALFFLLSCGAGTAPEGPTTGNPPVTANPPATGNNPPATDPNELADLPVFQSANGVLDILMEAEPSTTQLSGLQPQTWIYEVCQRSDATNNDCPNDSRTQARYGGVRLQLQAGDHLKIRLVNHLPPAPNDAVHMLNDLGLLAANPTNLHTHGMIVEPRQAGNGDPTYGDYVYVYGYPAGLMPPVASQHPGLDYTDQPIDYDIYLPPNHPSGIYWFHPHVHGLSLNQITAGMSGVITVGSINDYLTDASGAPLVPSTVPSMNLLLKDIQIEKDSSILTQENSSFCPADPSAGDAPREGYCVGQQTQDEDGNPVDYTGGRWVHSINGQVYPSIHIAGGEVWRITDAAGDRSYDLSLVDDQSGQPLTFQVLSLDGVSLDIPVGTPAAQIKAALHNRMAPVPCAGTALGSQAVCGTTMHVMPSSRAEIYVSSQTARSATLLTTSYNTGPAGDDWPSIKLAHVFFAGSTTPTVLGVHGASRRVLSRDGVLGAVPLVKLPGVPNDVSVNDALQLQRKAVGSSRAARQLRNQMASNEDSSCRPLAPGHSRRIFFGITTNPVQQEEDQNFGMGYEELDQNGVPVPGTFVDITPFDHTTVTVCLPLASGNQPVTEQWELVNVSGEDHNFHIHQTKFHLVDGSGDTSILMDSIAVPHGTSSCDGTVATWRSGQCQVNTVKVAIPFSQVGDFVYHCHILEHEDGGMMAHIKVVANPQ